MSHISKVQQLPAPRSFCTPQTAPSRRPAAVAMAQDQMAATQPRQRLARPRQLVPRHSSSQRISMDLVQVLVRHIHIQVRSPRVDLTDLTDLHRLPIKWSICIIRIHLLHMRLKGHHIMVGLLHFQLISNYWFTRRKSVDHPLPMILRLINKR